MLPPAELPRGVDVKGLVVNEQGEPVAGARIGAGWERTKAMIDFVAWRTDKGGRFVFVGVDPIAELRLTAWDGFAGVAAEVTVGARAAQSEPIVLIIDAKNTVPVGVRVIDLAGNPIAGARSNCGTECAAGTGVRWPSSQSRSATRIGAFAPIPKGAAARRGASRWTANTTPRPSRRRAGRFFGGG